MKVSSPRHERSLMVAGCLLAMAAIGGFSLFAQAPGTSEAPAQTGTAPPQSSGAATGSFAPPGGVNAPGTAAPGSPVTNTPPSAGQDVPGDNIPLPEAANSGALPPSVTPAPVGGVPASAAGLAPPLDLPPVGGAPVGEPPVGGGFGPPGVAPRAIPGKGSPGAKKSPGARPPSGAYGGSAGPGVPPPGMAGSPPPGMMGSGMMPGMGTMPGMMPGSTVMMSVSPEVALDQEIKSALKAYRTHANEPEVRAELVKAINNHIAEQFKIRQERREAEIKSIETELARVKQLHESRVANQEAIIAARLKELLSTADGLGWDLPDDSPAPGSGFSGQPRVQ